MATQYRLPFMLQVRSLREQEPAWVSIKALFADGEGYCWISATAQCVMQEDRRFPVKIAKNKNGYVEADLTRIDPESITILDAISNRDVPRDSNYPILVV